MFLPTFKSAVISQREELRSMGVRESFVNQLFVRWRCEEKGTFLLKSGADI